MFFKSPYCNYEVTLVKGKYSNGRLAISATDSDGLPAFTATVNLPEQHLEPDEVFIKDYSENNGVLNFLLENGIVTEVVGEVPTGYVVAHKCKVNINAIM